MRSAFAAAALAIFGLSSMTANANGLSRQVLSFSDLKGWQADNHAEALSVFKSTCQQLEGSAWDRVCTSAKSASNPRLFFETEFLPVLIKDGAAPLFTAYFEPELRGSLVKTAEFKYPLYSVPSDMPRGEPWLTRAEIEGNGALAGRNLEIAWLADPVEAFFLHVQGSGRLKLPDGRSLRVGFAAKNGHKYRSVGKEMVRRGHLPENRVSAGAIKSWVRKNPALGREVLWHNPSFVFFRKMDLPEDLGPIGAMGVPITAMRSIAVDPDATPLGAPVWVEKDGKSPVRSLMIAQDTGSAINGAQRADLFFGSGRAAGDRAGKIRDGGRMIVLLPKELAREN